MSSKLFLPVAFGVSLATASALLLYYVLKKDEDDKEIVANSKQESVKTARLNVIEVSVPKGIVPALIGRGGSNIKEIEKKSGASIIFKKFPEKDADICIIRGRTTDTQLAETMVHEFIRDQPTIVEDTISVPAWACGRIIGSGGDSIKDISHRSGARVKVESRSGEGDPAGQRLVTFRGTSEQIQRARDLVLEIVAHQCCLREIEQSKTPRAPLPPDAEPEVAAQTGEQSLPKHAKRVRPAGSAGASVEVYVSAVSSPSRFWVQLVGAQTKQLDELVEHMTQYYGDKANRELHQLPQVSVGQVVAAVFRHDGRWYRARVLALKPNEFAPDQQVADVIYLDYGDSEFVATHELCELRADLLRLRFQAMECFLAGVRPTGREEDVVAVTTDGQTWDRWHPSAIARFEYLTKVARWQSLMCATCTHKKMSGAGERDREVPGIRLYDVTDEGEIDIGEVLIEEGWAVATPITPRGSPRTTPPAPLTPFGDLGASRVLGLTSEADSSSQARDRSQNSEERSSEEKLPAPPPRPPLPSPAALSTPHPALSTNHKPTLNGTQNFIDNERSKHANKVDKAPAIENFVPRIRSAENVLPKISSDESLHKTLHLADPRDELKANMNRLDSHHNLEALEK